MSTRLGPPLPLLPRAEGNVILAKNLKFNPDMGAVVRNLRTQFVGLDPNDPSQWPALPKYLLYVLICVLVIVGIWFALIKSVDETLEQERSTELSLRADYKKKVAQAVSLEELKKQLEQVQQYVTQLEKQLPSKSEMDALLSDINQAGLGRSLQFELFKPGQVSVKQYYAELPITVRVTGRYHDIGMFAADIANLSRIVTLNNLTLSPVKDRDGLLTMTCIAKTFRYLDEAEVAASEQANKPKSNAKGGKK